MQTIISPEKKKKRQIKRKSKKILYIGLFFACVCSAVTAIAVVVIFDNDGNPTILPERKQKLESELAKYDNSEQYALFAKRTGNYPCYSCITGDSIFLLKGEVWKYGVSINGVQRYPPKYLETAGLFYYAEFIGDIGECLRQEKIKIYNYPILPESLKREIKLLRPPGNVIDR